MKRSVLIALAICAAIVIAIFVINRGEGVTPLMKAAKSGHLGAVERLLSKDAKVDEQSRYGWTALMFAAWQGHEDVAEALLEAGADPNISSGSVPSGFETVGGHPPSSALQEAVRNHHLNLAKILINGGAEIDGGSIALAAQGGHVEFLKYLKAQGARLNESSGNAFYATPLCAAAASGELDTVRWLIENGANPNQEAVGQTALKEAAYNDQAEIVDYLLRHGADPNQASGPTDEPALFKAIAKHTHAHAYPSNISIIQALLKHGADRSHKSLGGEYTALKYVQEQKLYTMKSIDDANTAEVKKRLRASLAHENRIIELLSEGQAAE